MRSQTASLFLTLFLALMCLMPIFGARAQNSAISTINSALPQPTEVERNVLAQPGTLSPTLQTEVMGVYRGTLGTKKIQLTLTSRNDDIEGIEGSYFVLGDGRIVLLAGEVETDNVWMEESANGEDVSGEWQGLWVKGVYEGTWQNADRSVTEHFSMQRISP